MRKHVELLQEVPLFFQQVRIFQSRLRLEWILLCVSQNPKVVPFKGSGHGPTPNGPLGAALPRVKLPAA